VFAFLLHTWRSSRNSFHSIDRTLLVQLMHQNDGLLPCIYKVRWRLCRPLEEPR
jgi:hypothetical protein